MEGELRPLFTLCMNQTLMEHGADPQKKETDLAFERASLSSGQNVLYPPLFAKGFLKRVC